MRKPPIALTRADIKRLDKVLAERRLIHFVRQAWPSMEPVPFTDGWHIEAVAEHLEAVTRGEIKRLIINYPPRMGKTSLVSICWPAWTWIQREIGPLSGPHVQWLCASYGHTLSLDISTKMRRLIESPWYQENWGDRFKLLADQNTKANYANDAGGARMATSVGGSLLGLGGAAIVVDDPHNTQDVESEAERLNTLRWWDEGLSTRLNDQKNGAVVLVMQRLHEEDLTGHILSKDRDGEWVHLCLPMEYDPLRHCETCIGFSDPRSQEGELLCPERIGPAEADALRRAMGPYSYAGKYQQSPTVRGGGIIKRDWWQPWEEKTYPPFEYIVAAIDTAYTEKEENDPSACVVLGVFRDKNDNTNVMLVYAWQERLQLNELVVRIAKTCRDYRVDRLLIENKATGISVHQELRRLLLHNIDFGIELVDPSRQGDKTARLYSVQHWFSDGHVFAPDKSWADAVVDQVSAFPRAAHDDLTDALVWCLRHLSRVGAAVRREEQSAELRDLMAHRGKLAPLYPA